MFVLFEGVFYLKYFLVPKKLQTIGILTNNFLDCEMSVQEIR